MFEDVKLNSERWFDTTNLKNEVWKDITDYEGLYQISNYGRVKSLGNNKERKEKILKGGISNGYCIVLLAINNIRKIYRVHRLVAIAFIENKENKLEVNHKDTNKLNNKIDNLEWKTSSENKRHAFENGLYDNVIKKIKEKNKKKIVQCDLNGNEIKVWESASEVQEKIGIRKSSICLCCKGKYKMAGCYKWKYYNK